MWYLEQLDPASPRLVLSVTSRLRGPLRPGLLALAIETVVRRHDALRTFFVDGPEGPYQEVSRAGAVGLPLIDLAALPVAERGAELERVAAGEALSPIDLAQPPLLRARLVRVGREEHVLLLSIHHIVSDAWSFQVVFREVAALYGALCAGAAPRLPEPSIQYADFAVWQRGALDEAALAPHLAYWRTELAGAPAALELPQDHPRPAVQPGFAGHRTRSLPRDLSDAVKAVGRRRGATPFMTLLAALETLLHLESGQRDVVVGTPIVGRRWTETEGLIGYFLNSVPLRARFGGDPSFDDLLTGVRRTVLEAYSHQDLPFSRLVAELQPRRDPSRSPVFQVLFLYVDALLPIAHQAAGLSCAPFEYSDRTVMHDMTLSVADQAEGLVCRLIYNRSLFEEATADALLAGLAGLLEAVAADPARRVRELAAALAPGAAAERRQLELAWNETAAPAGAEHSLHEIFAAQARATPAATALIAEGVSLTYAELDARSDSLARVLAARGVGPDQVVGLAVERSFNLVIGMLGILKAGGAYLPLDPEHPRDYLSFLLQDAGVSLVATQEQLAERLPTTEIRTVNVAAALPAAGEPAGAGGDNLAYVIYTSGSTGRPKGVMIPHRGVVNRLLWMKRTYPLTTADRVLHKSPFTFDVSLWEIFWPLFSGAAVVIARPGGHRDPSYLVRLIREEGVTAVQFVPSMLRVFLEEQGVEECRSLRFMACGGEALPADLERRCLEVLPGLSLQNFYGPTEASIGCSAYRCNRPWPGGIVPIGRPISNMALHVLDRELDPMAPGTEGELCAAGVGLARGYLGRPGLTAERFVPNPLARVAGERLYRTGDLARRAPAGDLEFLGRLDEQVKVSGFRIELGEIEAVLRRQPGVTDAAVCVRSGAAGSRLAAYVVPRGRLDVEALRAGLAAALPAYMVPAAFVTLAALPLNANGKLDRSALPEPEAPAAVYQSPAGGLEQSIAAVWREVLGCERVGSRDNFFDLGGHSLLMARVRNRLSMALSREIGMVELLAHPTVAALAGHLGAALPADAGAGEAQAAGERAGRKRDMLRQRRAATAQEGRR
jgi:amino acid adenylation domain-containing protein